MFRFLILLLVTSACSTTYIGSFASLTNGSKYGFALGNLHLSHNLVRYSHTTATLVIKDITRKRKHRVQCALRDRSNFVCFYYLKLLPGAYKFDRINFFAEDLTVKSKPTVLLSKAFTIYDNTITYLSGYSLQKRRGRNAKKKPSLVLVKSDNLANTIKFLEEERNIRLPVDCPILYANSKVRVLVSGVSKRAFNVTGEVALEGVKSSSYFLITKNIATGELYKLYVPAGQAKFYFNLPRAHFIITRIYLPDHNLVWRFPNEQHIDLEGREAVVLGKTTFFFNEEDQSVSFANQSSDKQIVALFKNPYFPGKSIWVGENFVARPQQMARANMTGYFSVSKTNEKKLVLRIKKEESNDVYDLYLDYYQQPFSFSIPEGRYRLQYIRRVGDQVKWRLAESAQQSRGRFIVKKGGLTYVGRLKFRILSDDVLSFENVKTAVDLKQIGRLMPKKQQLTY